MSIRLFLICHASTSALRTAAFPLDESLDSPGVAKAAAATGIPCQAGWSGPERRTRQTAAALGLTASIEPRLRDCDYGRWKGSTLAAIQGTDPLAVRQWLKDPAAAPHGGESLLDLLGRVGDWLDRLLAEWQRTGSARIAAVSHPAVIRAAVVHALGATPASFWRIDVAPLSRTELSGSDGRWSLRSIVPPAEERRDREGS